MVSAFPAGSLDGSETGAFWHDTKRKLAIRNGKAFLIDQLFGNWELFLEQFRALICFFGSAFAFSAATVFVKLAANAGVGTPTITFFRFLVGSTVLWSWFAVRLRLPKVQRWDLVFGRAVTNILAVYLFYETVARIGVTKGNLYNMTYPIFVTILSPAFLGEKSGSREWLSVMVAFVGVLLVVDPIWGTPGFGDLLGLSCGLTAAITVMILRKARSGEDVDAIVVVLMTTGMVLLLPFLDVQSVSRENIGLLVGSALFAVAGQLLFTYGYRYFSAVNGSLIGTTRVVIAGVFGVIFLGERLSTFLILGAGLIFFSLVLMARRKSS